MIVGTTVIDLVGEEPKRKSLLIYNNSAVTVYLLGDKGKTAEDGIPLVAGAMYEDSVSTGALYMVSTAAETDIRVMTVGE